MPKRSSKIINMNKKLQLTSLSLSMSLAILWPAMSIVMKRFRLITSIHILLCSYRNQPKLWKATMLFRQYSHKILKYFPQMERCINWRLSIQEDEYMQLRNSLCLMGSPETTSGMVKENDGKCCILYMICKFDINIIFQML